MLELYKAFKTNKKDDKVNIITSEEEGGRGLARIS